MAEEMRNALLALDRAYEAFNEGDFDTATELMHPEIDWDRVADVEQPLRGRESVRDFMVPDVFESQHTEVHAVEVVGDCILVDATFTGKGAKSGAEIAQRGFHLWRVKDGMAASFRYFLDRDEALEAARNT